MALSWSMDKIGPICRSVEDCALVFDAIYGPDGQDLTVVDLPFNYDGPAGLAGLRIGYLQGAFGADRQGEQDDAGRNDHQANARTLDALRALGVELIPIELPSVPTEALSFILNTEAAAAFDELTRSGRDDLLARQIQDAWPNVFRQSRLIPAVEYIQANRARTLLMQAMARIFAQVDVYVAPSFGPNLLLTNLTGHPAVVVPNGASPSGLPTSITFTGNLYAEAAALQVAKAFQDATGHHLKHPPIDD
jgi:Asp-tRNA(Asn)/Glu-tRNA(Gln) amidotransferase A subunit family amidase